MIVLIRLLLEKWKKSQTQHFFRHKDNLLKRKLVVCTMLASCMYHIYPVYLPRPPEIKKISKIIQKSLWGLQTTHRYRSQTAEKRIEFSFLAGGLGIWNPLRRAITSFLSSFVKSVTFIHKATKSNLAKICANHNLSLFKFLLVFGSFFAGGYVSIFQIFLSHVNR